jgi:2-keto-4-pentenoate hydratase/2-oxohepta-3-ene-1,7-dioic acid hydratase in catechol pathway
MRLASYLLNGKPHYGAVIGHGIVDLTPHIGEDFPNLKALIEHDGHARAMDVAAAHRPDLAFSDVTFLPPIPDPQKLWCIGVNYKDRNEEYKDASALPKYPSLFVRAPTSVVGHDQPIVRPRVSEQLDYEGEIVIVIGREGRRIPRARAHKHIFGLTLCDEGSVRDWLRHGKFNVTQGKNFDRSGSVGPWIVTSDEVPPMEPLDIMTRVNGEMRQHDSTERLMFPFDFLIEYLSTFATLKPGDLIATGTPTGAGARFDPPKWLVPGDVVEVESPSLGILRNTIVDEEF